MTVAVDALMRKVRKTFPPSAKFRKPCHDKYAPGVFSGLGGVAGARRVMAANRKVIVVEATGQIGGRCLTDTTTFDVPFDRGARWIHNPDTNPMINLRRNAGFHI